TGSSWPSTSRARSRLDVGLERIEGPAAVPVAEALEVRAGDALSVAQHDVPRDRLEAGPEVLARLDEDVALAARVDAAVGEHAEVEGLAASLETTISMAPVSSTAVRPMRTRVPVA